MLVEAEIDEVTSEKQDKEGAWPLRFCGLA